MNTDNTIPEAHLPTCKIGQGAACCRYLAMGAGGFCCEKHTDLGPALDARAKAGQMSAQSDNCPGFKDGVLQPGPTPVQPKQQPSDVPEGLGKPVVDLDNWCVTSNQDGYKAPEAVVTLLAGIVRGHPRIADGTSIKTSAVLGKVGNLVATRRSLYRLGNIDPAYEKAYPGAREKFMATLPELPKEEQG